LYGAITDPTIKQGRLDSITDVLPVAFNAVFTLSRLSFYGQLLEQLNVASLSRTTVFVQCYSLFLLYFWQINDDEVVIFGFMEIP